MRKFGRVQLSLARSIAVTTLVVAAPILGAAPATVAAASPVFPPTTVETDGPDLPFDPHEFGNGQWLGMPSHVKCDVNGEGSAELIISLTDDWTGATEIDISATASDAGSTSKDSVIWSAAVTVEPGSWEAVAVPVDDRGVRIWVSEEGFSSLGSITSSCQSEPVSPTRSENTITIPMVDDLHYFAAPATVDDEPIEAKWDSNHFLGFYVAGERLDEFSQPLTGEIAVPKQDLQVVVTGPFNGKIEFDWVEPLTSSWTFSYDADLAIPQTPLAPTQSGNVVFVPASESFHYVSGQGETVPPGERPITSDLVISAEANEGIEVAKGAVTTWSFTYGSEPLRTSPPTTPPKTDEPSATHLTAQTRGHTEMPTEAVAGGTILVTVGDQLAGQHVRVIMFSTPRDLGSFLVADDGTIFVPLPIDLEIGHHRLAVYDGENAVLGWDPVAISRPNLQAGATDMFDGPLSSSGLTLPFGTIMMAVLLLGAGTAAFILQRRRDHESGDTDAAPPAQSPTS